LGDGEKVEVNPQNFLLPYKFEVSFVYTDKDAFSGEKCPSPP